jgi:hypothetical protein
MNTQLFEKFSSVLTASNPPLLRDPRLLMEESGGVKVYYAPFEYLNTDARIVLVGITPGPTQMVNANNEARRSLLLGKSNLEAMKNAKDTAAFSGKTLRGNLINQLNHWDVHQWLGIPDSASLFAESRYLIQTTSLLRYPVFADDDDYRGAPDMIKYPLLKKYLFEHFVTEVEELKEAVFFGLGPQVQKVLDHLVQQKVLPRDRVIGGMLHPSGNCTYRINYLIGDRAMPVPHATNPVPYDNGRKIFQKAFLSI